MTSKLPVVIAGAGIGGLTLAITLARRGIDTVVLERAPELLSIGAGIQLSPNAGHVLAALGLLPAIDEHAVHLQSVHMVDGTTGRSLATIPLGESALRRWGMEFRALYRGDLQTVLLDAARESGARILLGHEVKEFAEGVDRVVIHFSRDGAEDTMPAAVLVGADGIRSAVRQELGLVTPLHPSGTMAWRATLPFDAPPETGLWLGPKTHLVSYPVSRGKLLNVVAITHGTLPEGAGWSLPGRREDLLAAFSAWQPSLRALLERCTDWQVWPLMDRSPDIFWGRGHVTLLGDAAHPMLPHLAQGAAMAIEDAYVLARHLTADSTDIPARLRAYEHERQKRTAQAQAQSRQQGKIYPMSGLAALARNAVLRRFGATRLQQRMDWIYSYRA